MKINWKVRFKNPVFIMQVFLAILTPTLSYLGLTVQDMTTWGALGNALSQAFMNPYVLGLIVLNVFNAVNDPTTYGVSDIDTVMTYTEPKR